MADVPEKPMPPALRVVRACFAGLLVFSLAFSIVMAAWGDLRDAIFVGVLDTRYAKSFVIRAPQGATVWLGDLNLGVADYPVIADSEPEAVIDGLSVREARVYAEDADFRKNSLVIEPGAGVELVLGKLAPGRKLIHAAKDHLASSGEFVPVLLAEDGKHDAALLCTLEIPRREGGRTLFAFLLRMDHEQTRWLSGATVKSHTTQLRADEGGFWTRRDEFDGLPQQVVGQLRTSWLFWPELATADAQTGLLSAKGVSKPEWVNLPKGKR